MEIGRVSIGRSIAARTRLSTLGSPVNEGFTLDFRKIDSKRARSFRPSRSLPPPPPLRRHHLVSFPFAHPRAPLRRNRPPAKRECISRLLSFPSISYRKEKELLGSDAGLCVSTVSSRCPRAPSVTHMRGPALTCTARLRDLQLITDFIAPSHDRGSRPRNFDQ